MITELPEIDYVRVYDKGVVGCINHNKDILLTFCDKEQHIYDVFLNQEQADYLLKQLQKEIEENRTFEKS